MSTELQDYTEQLIAKVQGVLAHFRQQPGRPGLDALLQRWEQQLQQMQRYAEEHAHVAIAFVGGTGAGKSTLLNAILEADLLPTHSFKTCTSAAIEVAYAARKSWRAQIQFLPLEAWESEKALFQAEVEQSTSSGHSSFVHQDFLYKAWSLYRPASGQPPMPFALADLLELLKEPLPESIQQQIAAGSLELKAKSPQALKQELSHYLTAESALWPLIQQVQISGPMPLLKDGLRLIDLPGLNDPNPARESIARQFLQQAEFIGLVFGTHRGLTREVVEVMKDQQFITQIVMDGKVSALSFIGTRADDFVADLEWQGLSLSAEADVEQIRQARAREIQLQIQQQLSELTLWFSNRYKVSEQSQTILALIASTLQQSPVFLTSALSYAAQLGWFQPSRPYFEQPEQTGVPQIQAYFQAIAAEQGIQARKKWIRSQFQQMNSEIRRLVESLKHRQSLQQLEQRQLDALQLQLNQLHQEQSQQLESLKKDLEQSLKLKQIQFEKQMLYAFADLPRRLEPLQARWQELNWQHLVKAVQHQGRYTSPSTGAKVNLVQDMLSTLSHEVALDWFDFFQQRLLKELEQTRPLISALLEQTQQALKTLLSQQPSERQPQLESIEKLVQTCEEILAESTWRERKQLESTIRQTQHQLEQVLEQAVTELMQPIFDKCAQFSGTGLKQQILETLGAELARGLPQVEDQLQQPLAETLQAARQTIERYQQDCLQQFAATLNSLCHWDN